MIFPVRFRLGQEALSVRTWQRERAFLPLGHASPERAGTRKHSRLLAHVDCVRVAEIPPGESHIPMDYQTQADRGIW